MKFLERIFGNGDDQIYFGQTASGELGDLIGSMEATLLERWLGEIERTGLGKSLSEKERRGILARDNYRCIVPGCDTPTFRLNVHHLVWREFGGSNDRDNLATICLNHHADAHPGLQEAFDNYRLGDHDSFKKYLQNNKRWKYQPTSRAIDVAFGIVYERNHGTK